MAAAVTARTVIGIDVAVAALVAIVTGAAVAVDFISARACVLARVGKALINIKAAIGALVAGYARTVVRLEQDTDTGVKPVVRPAPRIPVSRPIAPRLNAATWWHTPPSIVCRVCPTTHLNISTHRSVWRQ